jgi:hypothetical protein
MKDFIGKELQVGQEVVTTGYARSSFTRETIAKLTPKGVKLTNGQFKTPDYLVGLSGIGVPHAL